MATRVKGRTAAKKAATSKSQSTSKAEEPQENPHVATVQGVETQGPEGGKSRKLTEAEAKQIGDNEPGYSAEQLDRMAEYYGTEKQTTQGDVAVITPHHHLAGQDDAE